MSVCYCFLFWWVASPGEASAKFSFCCKILGTKWAAFYREALSVNSWVVEEDYKGFDENKDRR